MGRRKLKSGDRVKVTGPWFPGRVDAGKRHVGKYATVVRTDGETMLSLLIQIDGVGHSLWWCRKNVKALPREK